MQLLPRSLFGRLTLVLLTGLTTTMLLSASVHLRERGRIVHEAIQGDITERTVDTVLLLDSLPPAERHRLLPVLNGEQTRVGLADAPRELPPEDARTAGAELVGEQIRKRLGADTEIEVALAGFIMSGLMHDHGSADVAGPGRHGAGRHAMASRFIVQAQLKDGTWVWFERRIPREIFEWPPQMLLTLLILLAGVVTLSLVAVRWIVRPLDRLREAADALGKDIHRPPLPETGPVEVAETSRAFNTMQRRIGRFVEDRARMLAAISHDLRTPLTRLRLRADLLDNEELGDKIRRDLDEMQSMVGATLEFMRGTASREETRSLDLIALLESLSEDAEEAGAPVRLRGQVQTPYRGRPVALKRCIGNLLDNALRYGGEAEIEVTDSETAVTVTIADRGPGIPPESLSKVFEPFWRMEGSRGRDSGGTGLGLGIARNIARAHGGDLLLHNRKDGGLCAEVTLPR
ncbi:ATP-binding protein [Thiorhodovibrio winogradskyi]|uniref:ATP-binding protein n=2 Tax=Thiorhodovibrio TaxID=61593 RepID=UPI001911F3C8|nr:ATP-binding protein [Thiorhodovibrio winogradskyi]